MPRLFPSLFSRPCIKTPISGIRLPKERAITIIALLMSCLQCEAQEHTTFQPATALFSSAFDAPPDLRRLPQRPPASSYRLVRKHGRRTLKIKSRRPGDYKFIVPLPVDSVAGRKVLIRARLSSAGIYQRERYDDGIRIALHYTTGLTGDSYPKIIMPADRFDWQEVGFTVTVPPNATDCSFEFGLQQASGKVFFDEVSVSTFPVANTPDSSLPINAGGHMPTRLRGMMIPTFATAEDLRVLASWGANHVRWQLTWNGFPQSPADTASVSSYRKWLSTALDHVESLLPLCDTLGLNVILDLHTLPGGYPYPGQPHRLMDDTVWQTAFRRIWTDIAARFRNAPAIWGYDLANEPSEGCLCAGAMDWHNLAAATASDIRRIDTAHFIIAESLYGSWVELLSFTPFTGISRCLYSFHTYDPISFTHQGFDGRVGNIQYPGMIDGHYWNAATLRQHLQPVRDWQLKNRADIYVGEFSAVRWAPDSSAYYYLRDCINLFEDWGWSWDYHAFREWGGWSVEHGHDPDDNRRGSSPTDRQLLLMDYFRKNQR